MRCESRPSSASVKRCMRFSKSWIDATSIVLRRGKMKGSSLESPCIYSAPEGRDSRLSLSLIGLIISWMCSRMLAAIASFGLPFGFPLIPFLKGIVLCCFTSNTNYMFKHVSKKTTEKEYGLLVQSMPMNFNLLC